MMDGLPAWLWAILAAASAAALGYGAWRLALGVAARLDRDGRRPAWQAFLKRLRRPAGVLVPITAALLALPLAPPSETHAALRHALVVGLIAGLGWAAMGLLQAIGDIVVHRFRIDHPDNLAQRQVQTRMVVINRIGNVVIVVVTAALALMTFPGVRHIGVSLFASAGVAGLVIGLAARPAIGNLIAGIQVALTQPIRVDDVVIVEGEWGWIEEITTTYVVVRIWDWRRLVIPISQFIEKPFQNWTRKTADIIGTIFLHADYTVPVDALRDELNRLAKAHPKWDGKVCVLQVTDATPQTVELRALVSSATSPFNWDLRCDVREGLIKFLQTNYPECLPRVRAELKEYPKGDSGAAATEAGPAPPA